MSRDKQIEEMARHSCFPCLMGNGKCAVDLNPSECYVAQETANKLYSAGYRKASEVAREIFEEIEKILDRHSISYHKIGEIFGEHYYDGVMQFDIDELKKKYTEKLNIIGE